MRLKELREESNLRQIDVANAIKTSQTNIGRWENEINEPCASFVIKLADFFGVTTDYLLGRTDDLEILSAGNGQHYSPEEMRLIQDYRGLAQPLKDVIQTMIKTWQGGTSEIFSEKKK